MKLLPELVQDLESELAKCVILVQKHCFSDFATPQYRMDLQGKNAGMALLEQHCIRFHQTLLIQHGALYIHEVVPHELAHLAVYRRFGLKVKPHGHEWKWIMQDIFAREPRVTHNFAVKLHRKKVYQYTCVCSKFHEFSVVRHKRAQQGTRYLCRVCKQPLHQVSKSQTHHANQLKQQRLMF